LIVMIVILIGYQNPFTSFVIWLDLPKLEGRSMHKAYLSEYVHLET